MRDCNDLKIGDTGKIQRVAGVKRQAVGNCGGGDERVEGSGLNPPATLSELARYPAVRSGCGSIEGKDVETTFGLLQPTLPHRLLCRIIYSQRADAEFCKGDGGDDWLVRQLVDVKLVQQDDRVGVEDPDLLFDQSD